MAYVLGFFAADGYMGLNNRGAYFWSIQITDEQLLESIKNVIGAEHKIGVRRRFGNQSTLYRLQIGSKEMYEDLCRLGFMQRKTKSLALPNVPQKYFADFVRGYFDGDGHVWVGTIHKERKTRHIAIQTVFTSCSKEFLSRLKVGLFERGIVGGGIACKNGYYRLYFSIRDSVALYQLMYSHCTSPLFLRRKKIVFERFLAQRKNMRL